MYTVLTGFIGYIGLQRLNLLGVSMLATSIAGDIPHEVVSPLPAVLDISELGAPTFDENWLVFDQGVDQARPVVPHRWRTVFGYGGATAPDNRSLSATSVALDRSFPGVREGKPGTERLGLDPFVLDRGRSLTIEARRTPEGKRKFVWDKPYYSGMISTKFSFAQRHGYFEIEARLPTGKGMWPAFWLLPVTGRWPGAGEVDIFEGLGDPSTIYCTVIYGNAKMSQAKVAIPFDVGADFHRYGLAWSAKELVWYVDRREVARRATPPSIDRIPMYMLLNLAVGGAWGGQPNALTEFPGRFVIRRVTAWQLPGE